MMPGQILFALQRLERARRRFLVRAVVTLAGSSAAVAFLPFRRALAFGSVAVEHRVPVAPVSDLVWAVEAAARRVPWRAKCIERGLAAQRLLRKSGVNALLHYGARHDESSGLLQAHVWVTVDGDAVIGGEEAPDYREMAVFP